MNNNLIVDIYFNPDSTYEENLGGFNEPRYWKGIDEIKLVVVPDAWKNLDILDIPFSTCLQRVIGYTFDYLTGLNQFDLNFYQYLQREICKTRWIVKKPGYTIQNKKFYIELPKQTQLTIYEGETYANR